MAKRWYELNYPDQSSIFLEDFGNILKLSGVLYSGKGKNILLLTPQTDFDGAVDSLVVKKLSLDEMSEVIRMTDDPKWFEMDETNSIKAIHRKCRMAISGAVQQRIWVRDNLTCQYCGREIGDVQLTVDHFIPLELGGQNDQTNYITACRSCNKKKGNIHPQEYCVVVDGTTMFSYEYYKMYLENASKIR